MDKTVLILLATYNGAQYVCEMIDSVLAQDYSNIHIVVSDDCSKDDTADILHRYAQQHPNRITHYRSGLRFGCAQKHFMHLLRQFHDSDYVMFCDQDDVWHPDKISKTLKMMQSIETDRAVPALVHTDLRVVDSSLKTINESFCRNSGMDGSRMKLNQLLVQNVVTGCTMMLNRSLAELCCRDFPENAMLMHDWWIALVASACGKIAFLNEATIDYRQHGDNSVGAKNVYSAGYLINRLRSQSMRKTIAAAAVQAQAFAACYADLIDSEQKALIEAFGMTAGSSLFKRDYIYLKYKLLKKGTVRVAAQLLGL